MMRPLLSALVLLLSMPLASARAAEATSWGTTFPANTLATHLGDAPARYMVVPAGAETPELAQAEQALAAALRSSGKALLVMNAQALGPVAQLDDASIVRRGAGFPVDRVVVLRLFPDASGALTQAVVTTYDTTGQSLGSFSAVAGTALAARDAGPSAAPQQAPALPKPVAPARPVAPLADAVEQYEQRHIGFDELVAVSTRTGAVMSKWTMPYEGKFKKPLDGEAFYQKLGRNDLVDAYQSKMTLKTVTGIAGGAAIVGGAILSITALSSKHEDCDAFSPDFRACFERNRTRFDSTRTTMLAGIGTVGVGIGLLGVTLLINPHPITPSEARELADGYNKQLKAELGLTDDGTPAPVHPSAIQAHLTPVVGPGGAGLQLSGTF
ncbi:hypothetical protein [Archangium lipolyticum]|uniref:hypothetical protein n=1 Tax=Archangium lipolyticum TaxID=2970465 RepID=UPI002149E3CE|nr:hypothetical protein [Archangium lipolyticum]